MNHRRLDVLPQLFADASPRRAALRTLAGSALAAAATALGARPATAGDNCFIRGKRCRYDRQCCTRDCRFGWCR